MLKIRPKYLVCAEKGYFSTYTKPGHKKAFKNPRSKDQYPKNRGGRMRRDRFEAVLIVLLLISLIAPVTATVYFSPSAPGIITKGDSFSVSGTGAVNGTIRIWIIGRDHFEGLTTAPDRHGNFSISIKPTITQKYKSGRYAVVFQDPGPGGLLEIEPGSEINGNPAIMNRGKIIARLGSRQDLGGNIPTIVQELFAGAAIPGVNDIFQPAYFFVEEPAVNVDRLIPASGSRLPDVITGDRVFFSGTTNIGTSDSLRAEIFNLDTNEPTTTKMLPVSPGNEMNTWSYEIKAPGLPPGNYNLTVTWTASNTTGKGVFAVKNPLPPTPAPIVPAGDTPPAPDNLPFLILIGSTLLVLAIVLYATGRK
jgi:hypothetical protein